MDIMNSMYPTINHSYTRASESDFLVFLSIGHASFHSRHHNSWRSDKIIVLRGKSTRVQSPRKKSFHTVIFSLSLFSGSIRSSVCMKPSLHAGCLWIDSQEKHEENAFAGCDSAHSACQGNW